MNHSQNQEQEAILKYFGDLKGTFLDLGANNGVTLSNTRALAERGWCGVLVEPSPIPYRQLEELYANSKGCFYTYECAIGNKNGKGILYDSGELLKQGDHGLVSTLVIKEIDRFKSVLNYEMIQVKIFRWKTFLNRLSLKKFEFISIDCEGMDADILDQIDVSETQCVCIEWNSHQDLKDRFSKKLEGFRIIYTSGENLIYGR